MKPVVAPAVGVEIAFNHDVKNLRYPLIAKSAKSFVPYVSSVWIREKFAEAVFTGSAKNRRKRKRWPRSVCRTSASA